MTAPVPPPGAEREAFIRRLAAASALHAEMLVDAPVEIAAVAVPDTLRAAVFHVIVGARRRPIELYVAEFGSAPETVVLGAPPQLDELARRVGLRLERTDDTAAYLRLWCRVAMRRTDHLVESAADFRWIPGVTSDPDLRVRADRAAHLARRIAVGQPAHGAFPAELTVLEQRTLHLRRLRVSAVGHVDELERIELMRDVPVPYTIP